MGLVATGCGDDSGAGRGAVSNDGDPAIAQEMVAAGGECAQLSNLFLELLGLTNEARRNAGIGALQFSYQLGQSAQSYAEELATQNFFSHTGKDGSTLRSRIDAVGYQHAAAGENLAAGQSVARSVFQGWMESDGHRANLLQADFTEVGFGWFDATGSSDYGRYWVQHFGKPQDGSSRADMYIPDTCGLPITHAQSPSEPTVAGISITQDDRLAPEIQSEIRPQIQPKTRTGRIQPDSTIQPFAGGQIPVTVLAVALTGDVEVPSSVPEPAALLGLGAIGLLLWRDRSRD